jgi:hypothetical protein
MSGYAPEKILLAIPCVDRRIYTDTMMGIISVLSQAQGAVVPYVLIGDSNIAHARNTCAHYFKNKTDCDTLFFLDSDIVFTPQDFACVLDGDEQVVVAPYARKVLGMPPVGWGMGFCRIHRSVFEMLDGLLDPHGAEQLGRYYVQGEGIATHYFQTGPSQDAQWYGEDSGFWHLCAQAGITLRTERRTRLGHIGTLAYECPHQIPPHVTPYQGPGPYPDVPDEPVRVPVDHPELLEPEPLL